MLYNFYFNTGLPPTDAFRPVTGDAAEAKGYTLCQKMVGKACGFPNGVGVLPGTYGVQQQEQIDRNIPIGDLGKSYMDTDHMKGK